jgi:hypothetical protein
MVPVKRDMRDVKTASLGAIFDHMEQVNGGAVFLCGQDIRQNFRRVFREVDGKQNAFDLDHFFHPLEPGLIPVS